MARAFTARSSGALIGRMNEFEIDLVIEALASARDLLTQGLEPTSDEQGSAEDELFASLAASMQERDAPQDPALRRLLPDAGADPEVSAEFRRLTEDGLRRQKSERLDLAIDVFGRALNRGGTLNRAGDGARRVELTRQEARATMMALTDARLVVAERLGVHTDADAEELHAHVEAMELPQNRRDMMALSYDFVTWLSESLTVAYLGQA